MQSINGRISSKSINPLKCNQRTHIHNIVNFCNIIVMGFLSEGNQIPSLEQLLKTMLRTNYECRYNFVGNLSSPINLSLQKLKIKDGRLRKKRTFFHDELIRELAWRYIEFYVGLSIPF